MAILGMLLCGSSAVGLIVLCCWFYRELKNAPHGIEIPGTGFIDLDKVERLKKGD